MAEPTPARLRGELPVADLPSEMDRTACARRPEGNLA